ncbi:MAG: hypothetical protein AAFV93_20965 [Chloroflexota bacterium]
MTQLMEQALAQIATLSDEQQDTIAAIILAELESEERWEKLFEESQDLLSELADEALDEHHAGKSKPLNLDEL